MFCILIVEDEKIERETLKAMIEKEVAGCDLVVAARNGKEAMELFTKHHPKLVCADINLPGMNGLDMIRAMKQQDHDVQYLIVSSYNYFAYAQEGIRLGVNDFILKPYHIPTFIEVLENNIKKIQESRFDEQEAERTLSTMTPMLEKECLYAIVADETELELRRRIHLLDEQLCSGFCLMIRPSHEKCLHVDAMSAILKDSYVISAQMHGTMVYFLLYRYPLSESHLRGIQEELEHSDIDLANSGIGPAVNDICDFHRSFLLAREHIGKKRTIQEQLLAFEQSTRSTQDLVVAAQCFMDIFEKSDDVTFKKELHIFIEDLMSEKAEDIISALNSLYENLLRLITERYPNLDIKELSLLPLYRTPSIYQDFPMNLNLNLKKMYHIIKEERFRNTNYLVKEALQYIDQNYQKQIVLADVAQYLRVSPYHISRLLSTSQHRSFTELVAEKRVEASKTLLKRDERIKEIAQDVGFQGQSYYNKIFKKYTGMTPKEYRNKVKN